jgi:hypothetical protein
MAKATTPKSAAALKDQATVPGRVDAPVEGGTAPEPELTPEAVEPASAPEPELTPEPEQPAVGIRCRVNWKFSGFREQDLNEGDVVETDLDEARPYLGGVLSLHQDAQ